MHCPPRKNKNEKMTDRRRGVVVGEKGCLDVRFGCAGYRCRVSVGLTDSRKTVERYSC